MICVTKYDRIIPDEVMQKEFGDFFILMTGSIKNAKDYYVENANRTGKAEVRIYSSQNMQKAALIKQELDRQEKWFEYFDDIGIPHSRFYKSIDMWGRRALVSEWALLLTKNALPDTEYMKIDGHGVDHYPIRKENLDHLAQFTSGMDRPNLYLALSQNRRDREVAKRVVDKIYERFQSKKERKIEERIGLIKQILELDHVSLDYVPEPSQKEVHHHKEPKPRGILQKIFGRT